MRGGEQLHTALRDGARGQGLGLGTDLVDDHHLGHVILHRFDLHNKIKFDSRRGEGMTWLRAATSAEK